jgi:hypothetical protein
MILSLPTLAWPRFREPAVSPFFISALAFVLAVAVLVIPTGTPPYNQLFLLPAILLVARAWRDSKPRNSLHRLLRITLAAIVASPWLLAFALVLRRFLFHRQSLGPVPNAAYASMGLPFAILALLILTSGELSLGRFFIRARR